LDKKDGAADQCYDFIEKALKEENGVLVYSVKGKGRSCVIIIVYLMRKYRWSLFKALEFVNLRMPELEISAKSISQLETYKDHLIARGLGPKSSDWSKVYEKTIEYENEELMLRNTYLNSQVGPFANYQIEEVADKSFRLKWIDQVYPTKHLLAIFIDEKSIIATSKTQDTLPNELMNEAVDKKVENKRIRLKAKSKVNMVRVKNTLSMESHLMIMNKTEKMLKFSPAKAQQVPSFTTLSKFHRSTKSNEGLLQKKTLSRSNSDIIYNDNILLNSVRDSRNKKELGKNILKRKSSIQETKKGPDMRIRVKVMPHRGEESFESAKVIKKESLRLNGRVPHSIAVLKINLTNVEEASGRNINPKKMLRTINTNSVKHFNN